MSHAVRNARLGARQPDGATLRQHLEAAHRATGVIPDELIIEPLHWSCSEIWSVFLQLAGGRQSGGMSPNPISQTEIQAWQSNQRVRLTPWEVDVLLDMDRAVLHALTSKEGGNHGNSNRHTTD